MLNKPSYDLIYLELKGQDRATYNNVRSAYKAQYESHAKESDLKTPFDKVWAKILSHLRNNKYYGYRKPPKLETPHQKIQRLQTAPATHAELERARTRLRNFKPDPTHTDRTPQVWE
jgi:hypothetical protein